MSTTPHDTRDSSPADSLLSASGASSSALALVLVWSRDELERIGELVLLPPIAGTHILGRGGDLPANQRLAELVRQRPGRNERTGPLASTLLSRSQLAIRGHQDALEITNVGRAALLINGLACESGRVVPGDLVEVERRAMLLCVRRPATLPDFALAPEQMPPRFGEADAFGLGGESAAPWELRRELAVAARRNAHVRLVGPSGSGKECAVMALHSLSPRQGELLSRNAATIPASLLDAELFGHARDYPNAGMPARSGLVGEADGGTLVLDEIGELPHDAQAHLLRVMDHGEYQRLGESRPRRSRVRVIAATNRDPEALKHDLLARFPIRIRLTGLEARPEDLPLLARHFLRAMAREDPEIEARVFRVSGDGSYPRLAPGLVRQLLRRRYHTHAREVLAILWASLRASADSPYLVAAPAEAQLREPDEAAAIDPAAIDEAAIRAALERAGGVKERAWRLLGLSSRYQLHRLLNKYGID